MSGNSHDESQKEFAIANDMDYVLKMYFRLSIFVLGRCWLSENFNSLVIFSLSGIFKAFRKKQEKTLLQWSEIEIWSGEIKRQIFHLSRRWKTEVMISTFSLGPGFSTFSLASEGSLDGSPLEYDEYYSGVYRSKKNYDEFMERTFRGID